jgi:hypothetical protein
MGKVEIYFANDALNKARQVGVSALSGRVRSGQYAGSLATIPGVLTKEEKLQTDGGSDNNDLWLSIDGTNFEGTDIHIIGARINVTKKNSIKATALVSRAGKVKERIQADDYTVKISGSLSTDEAGKFPYELLKQLNGILSSADSIYVASAYLDIFEITQLAFVSADFNQDTAAYFNVMPFTLSFDSDKDYEFLIDEG